MIIMLKGRGGGGRSSSSSSELDEPAFTRRRSWANTDSPGGSKQSPGGGNPEAAAAGFLFVDDDGPQLPVPPPPPVLPLTTSSSSSSSTASVSSPAAPPASPRSRYHCATLAPLPEANDVAVSSGDDNAQQQHQDDECDDAPAIPKSPSPGTPPKKVWERSYRNFLKMSRIRQDSSGSGGGSSGNDGISSRRASSTGFGSRNLVGSAPAIPTTTHLQRYSSDGTGHVVVGGSGRIGQQRLKSFSSPSSSRSRQQQRHQRTSSLASCPASSPLNGGGQRESSVRGGKLFASVFARGGNNSPGGNSNSSAISGKSSKCRKSKSMTSADELDVALRRGMEKSYSPGSSRYIKNNQQNQNLQYSSSPASVVVTGKLSASTSMPQINGAGNDGVAIAGGTGIGPAAGGVILGLASGQHRHLPYNLPSSDDEPLPPPPPAAAGILLLRPRASSSEEGFDCAAHINRALCLDGSNYSSSSDLHLHRQSPPLTTAVAAAPPSAATTSSAVKKAFTEFHNSSTTGRDAVSAYLGDDPSTKRGKAQGAGHSLAWTQNNAARTVPRGVGKFASHTDLVRHNTILGVPSSGNVACGGDGVVVSAACETGGLNGIKRVQSQGDGAFLETVFESGEARSDTRVLKPVQSVEAWQTGRRYLIAPAALTACPAMVMKVLAGGKEPVRVSAAYSNSFETLNKMGEPSSPSSSAFGSILLGPCLMSSSSSSTNAYSGIGLKSTPTKQWASAVLVLRQNYLLEYSPDVPLATGMPRGFAHLQHSKCYTNSDFPDALELHFFGSPCAKSDKRVLMIRVQRREDRDAWIWCLNRASTLSIEDLYEFDEKNDRLSEGSYATVYSARRKLAGTQEQQRSCALKVFDKNKYWKLVVKGRERADTLVRETSVLATVTAKCGRLDTFVKILGFFETSDHVVLELELLEGTDLFKYIMSKGVVAESTAASLIRDVLQSLKAMNNVGLAHRDIKPANILMCSGREGPACKVADFGMSTFVGVDGHLRGRCGTPGFVAPEIFDAGLHGGYGNKVDVFSAGVTLYVMLCGYEPFYGETDAELIEANKNAEVEFPEDEWKSISAAARDLVQKMMHPDPHQRVDATEALNHPWFREQLGESGPHLERRNSLPVTEAPADDVCAIS